MFTALDFLAPMSRVAMKMLAEAREARRCDSNRTQFGGRF
jgi:hypothetical protein